MSVYLTRVGPLIVLSFATVAMGFVTASAVFLSAAAICAAIHEASPRGEDA